MNLNAIDMRDRSSPPAGGVVAVNPAIPRVDRAALEAQTGNILEDPQDGLLQVLRRRVVTVVLVTLLSVAGATAFVYLVTPTYKSTTRVYIEQRRPKVLTDGVEAVGGSENYLRTQCEILKSSPVLVRAVEQGNIAQMRSFVGVEHPTDYLADNLDVQVGKKDDIISVSFSTPYREDAAPVVNSVVNAYIELESGHHRSTASEALRILQAEQEKVDVRIAKIREAMAALKSENPAMSFEDPKNDMIMQWLDILNHSQAAAQDDSLKAKIAYEHLLEVAQNPAQVDEMLDLQEVRSGSVAAVNDQQLHDLRAELIALTSKLDAVARLGFDHPARQLAIGTLDRVTQAINERKRKLVQTYVIAARQEWAMAVKREDEIKQSVLKQQRLTTELNIKSGQYAQLAYERQQLEKQRGAFDTPISSFNLSEDTGAMNINIVERAVPGNKPSSPRKALILLSALGLGTLVGCGTALVRDRTDLSLRTPRLVVTTLGVPVIGVVPHVSPRRRKSGGQQGRIELDPAEFEAFRMLRATLHLTLPGDRSKTLLVASPSHSEGKSFTASNLAIAMAQTGRRVLLLDADLRNPSQHLIFSCPNETGVTTVLSGTSTLRDAIRHLPVPNLDLLSSGPIPSHPSEILERAGFARMLRVLAKHYDHVVLDSPPIGVVADARLLGALCDATVLVVRSGRSTTVDAVNAGQTLVGVGARIAGLVVNDSPDPIDRYGYVAASRRTDRAGRRANGGSRCGEPTVAVLSSSVSLSRN